MLQESLVEKLLVVKYCIEYRKDTNIWRVNGCYGYPALDLLLSIVDTIGSFVINGGVRKHFDILNDIGYFNLSLKKKDIDIIYQKYRCFSTHNSVLGLDCILEITNRNGAVYEHKNRKPYLYLEPLYKVTQGAVEKFLSNAEKVVYQSKQLRMIINS